MERLEALSKIITILAAIFGGAKFFIELKRGNRQKEVEFRWKKAELAREILDEMFTDQQSRSALRMLDWDGRSYEPAPGLKFEITSRMVLAGLRIEQCQSCPGEQVVHDGGERLKFTPEEQFVRDCFERLYDMTDSIEHFIRCGLLVDEDVMRPLAYYAACIAAHKTVHQRFWDTYGYELTLAFFGRFKEFNDPAEIRR